MHEGHRKRLKKRFANEGLESFESHNVLELLLFYSIPRRDTNEIAHRLIDRFGSLEDVFNASVDELVKIDGVGECTALLIKVIDELIDRYVDDIRGKGRNSSAEVFVDTASDCFEGSDESLVIMCLDSRLAELNHHFIPVEIKQDADGCDSFELDAGELTRLIANTNATSIVAAHRHDDSPQPLKEDFCIVREVNRILKPMGVSFVDYIIICKDIKYSLMCKNSRLFESWLRSD